MWRKSEPVREAGRGRDGGETTSSGQSAATASPLAPPASRCYFHNGGWQPIKTIVDTIRVKGAQPRIVRLDFTHHGPIVSMDSARGRAVAMRMVGQEPGTAAYLASLQLGRAQKLARLPARDGALADAEREHDLRGCGRKHWLDRRGLHAASQLVRARSPCPAMGASSGTASSPGTRCRRRTTPRAASLRRRTTTFCRRATRRRSRYDWASRLSRVPNQGSPGEPERLHRGRLQALQHDDLSLLARHLVPQLVSAAQRLGKSDSQAVQMLARWNFRMSRDASAPLLFEAWAPILARRGNAMRLPAEAAEVISKSRRL